jgi:RimJ/RimL family protein N-acetyltransferase
MKTIPLSIREEMELLAQELQRHPVPDTADGFKTWKQDNGMWQEESVYEIGWSVLLPYQGRGIATAAVAEAIASARTEQKLRFIHSFPSINNLASERSLSKAHLFAY